MADEKAIRLQIMEAIRDALREGPLVQEALLEEQTPMNVDEHPAVLIRDLGDSQRRHIRLAYECRMALEILIIDREGEPDGRRDDAHDVLAEVYAALNDDETWGGLAIRTTIVGQLQIGVNEVNDPLAIARVPVEILYRVKRDDMTAVRAI